MTGAMLLPEFDHEMSATRRALERIPEDRLDFRPHDKSWTLRELAAHVAQIPAWTPITLATTELDISQPFERPPCETKADILAAFDGAREQARAAIASATEEALRAPWTLKSGDHVAFTLPREAVLRSFVLNHGIHHRGQLTVYLRLTGAPVPALYGPSGDEQG